MKPGLNSTGGSPGLRGAMRFFNSHPITRSIALTTSFTVWPFPVPRFRISAGSGSAGMAFRWEARSIRTRCALLIFW